jgi:hypothetical protein
MMLTSLQKTAIDAWETGHNVRIMAVPGAGKSRVLIEACANADSLCIILAYNRELCLETKDKISRMGLSDWVICMTFHGLATYCVGPTYDDATLADVLHRLDAGQISSIRKLSNIGKILIDEAQDFRPSFLRLIRHLIEMNAKTQYMVVGDSQQMLYDYSEDDPASLDYLQRPEEFFESERDWKSVTLDETHRMSPEMTHVISRTFDLTIHSPKSFSRPVEVFTINQWRAGPLLATLLRGEHMKECCVLVPRKKNNGPLRATVNYLSRQGIRLFIHGIDGQDPRIKRNKLSISTWHASKGTQKRVCVVLGLTNEADTNPSFVALTRGEERLIIIQDEQMPHHRLLKTIADAPKHVVVVDDATRLLAQKVDHLPPTTPKEFTSDLVCVDAWRPSGSGRWMYELMTVETDVESEVEDDANEEDDEIIAGLVGDLEDVADIYRMACLMAAEKRVTKTIRRMTDIHMPLRMTREAQKIAVKHGNHSRFVTPNVPEDSLLDTQHKQRVLQIYAKHHITTDEWCFLSCATRAWNSYHHTLRQLHPFDWMDKTRFDNGLEYVLDVIGDASFVDFDVRLTAVCEGQTLHARCDASSPQTAYMFIWQTSITYGHRMEAAIIAALHQSGTCTIVNIRTETTQCVNVLQHQETIRQNLIRNQTHRQAELEPRVS